MDKKARCEICSYEDHGRCRRASPQLMLRIAIWPFKASTDGVWPSVKASDWCGNWTLDAEKQAKLATA